jgi:hypothetical protein
VGDEQHREVQPLADLVEQPEHLGLHRDVQRRDRLVRDQQLGLHRQRPGDADPLPLPARELVRVAAERVRVEPDQAQQLGGPAPSLAAGTP